MKVNFTKIAGGVLVPFSQNEVLRMQRFKNGDVYEIDIKLARDGGFNGKLHAFFDFCFNYWNQPGFEYSDETVQREEFRKQLTILAGFKEVIHNLDGTFKIEAKSLKYSMMDQEEVERLFRSLIDVVMHKLFKTDDKKIMEKLFKILN